MKKTVKAVAPYFHPGYLNFKTAPYEAWIKLGGQTAKAHYPTRRLHGMAYKYELPDVWKNKKEARLRFVEPVSLTFDTFPDYFHYEVIPMVWDCWPKYFEKMCSWLQKHNIKTAVFTSSQTKELIQSRFPQINLMYCPEAVDSSCYSQGKPLKERSIDVLEFGRSNKKVFKTEFPPSIKHICTRVNGQYIYSNEQLYEAMADAKITIVFPRNFTQPHIAGDIETLTQRYWENMLSRMVMVGHAPKELINLIGYNPVIELDLNHAEEQITEILTHIDKYQQLVNKNRETALKTGDWSLRMQEVMKFLRCCKYDV